MIKNMSKMQLKTGRIELHRKTDKIYSTTGHICRMPRTTKREERQRERFRCVVRKLKEIEYDSELNEVFLALYKKKRAKFRTLLCCKCYFINSLYPK